MNSETFETAVNVISETFEAAIDVNSEQFETAVDVNSETFETAVDVNSKTFETAKDVNFERHVFVSFPPVQCSAASLIPKPSWSHICNFPYLPDMGKAKIVIYQQCFLFYFWLLSIFFIQN